MSVVQQERSSARKGTDHIALIRELGPRFAARAAGYDAADTFVAENYAELKSQGVFAAGIPGTRRWWRDVSRNLRNVAHSGAALQFDGASAGNAHTPRRGDGLALAAGPARRALPASRRQ